MPNSKKDVIPECWSVYLTKKVPTGTETYLFEDALPDEFYVSREDLAKGVKLWGAQHGVKVVPARDGGWEMVGGTNLVLKTLTLNVTDPKTQELTTDPRELGGRVLRPILLDDGTPAEVPYTVKPVITFIGEIE